ncbi:hypothetical protein CW304_01295 [Bacillus sp. UFRGS-B20]|nr:hypothetical protein CW304_01295 [Bacillus sp. UFRGS-B20]
MSLLPDSGACSDHRLKYDPSKTCERFRRLKSLIIASQSALIVFFLSVYFAGHRYYFTQAPQALRY